MADDSTNNVNKIQGLIDALNKPSAAAAAAEEAKKKSTNKNESIGQTEFLDMLIAQLKNQDPLNPMDGQNFAAQLAQFSQLEQLMNINETLSKSSGGEVSSMASFLGHEVVLKDSSAHIAGGKGPNLSINVPSGLQSARLDVIKAEGGVAQSLSLDLTDLKPGQQVFGLDGLKVPDGDYTFRLVGVNQTGVFKDIDYKITGTVEGFVMEPKPMLLVNGKEVSVDEVSEVLQGRG